MNRGCIMRSKPISLEQRQHINLSQYAYDIVRNDSLNFLGTLNISGFINTIVNNSKVDSFDDLSIIEEERLKDELSSYSKSGRTVKLSEPELEIIKKIAVAHRSYLMNSSKIYSKDVVLKIRLNNKLYNELYSSDWDGDKYGLSQGEYIKSIIEEYARKTIFDRESVFYKEVIDDINRYVSVTDTEKRILLITYPNGKKFLFKPYRLSENYEANFHYLIGMSKAEGEDEYKIVSFRLSRIKEIRPRGKSLGSGKITKKEEKLIEKRLKESGVQYMLDGPEKYVIQLTKYGMNLYNSIYNQRPVYDLKEENKDGTYTLTINATNIQITNYFFQFGKEAMIISPIKTRNSLGEKYTEAAYVYRDMQD